MWKLTFFITSCFISVTLLNIVNGIEIDTIYGRVRGLTEKSRDGLNYFSFRGMRYARPPVQELRFEPPQDPESWDDIFDATKDGHICYQKWPANSSDVSEDCLVLNVYTKDVNEKRPVIVYIHGGSFSFNSGHSIYQLGPQYFMDRDVVLVTINYRLGIFGFITTNSKEAPGNLGFKDQLKALRWVQKNIEKFGGDPDLVTLVGQSVGALSVTLHMTSPASKGLFHRAIAMSGSSTTRIPALNRRQTRLIASEVDCPIEQDPGELVNCLRKIDADKLIQASEILNEFGNDPIRKWNFIVEEDFGQERFLIEDPNVVMREGRFHRIPFMTGVTSTEFAYRAGDMKDKGLLKEFNEDFDIVAPICFLYERSGDHSEKVSAALKKEYFQNKEVTEEKFDELAQLFSDGIVRSGLKRLVDRVRKYQDVYLYTNSFLGRYSHFYYPDNKPYGVGHSDDLLYLFVKTAVAPMFTQNDPENFMVEKLLNVFTTFAKTGTPSNTTDNVWNPTNKNTLNWYELSEQANIDRTFLDRISTWDILYPENE